jgi:alkylhydroperoxidase/carboxymuconolactone decarboxylase family protein YurZ
MTESRYDKGLKLFGEIYGDAAAASIDAYVEDGSGFGVEQARWTLEFAFGALWSRGGIERKLRSAAVLGMLIAQGAHEEIKYHTRMGMKNGLTRTELEEIFYSAILYAGFPAANAAKKAMLEGFAEMEGSQA